MWLVSGKCHFSSAIFVVIGHIDYMWCLVIIYMTWLIRILIRLQCVFGPCVYFKGQKVISDIAEGCSRVH